MLKMKGKITGDLKQLEGGGGRGDILFAFNK